MLISKKAKVYARSLFELDKGIFPTLKNLEKLFCEDKSLSQFFVSPIISLPEKKKLLEEVSYKMPNPLKHFLLVLLENKSFFLLPQIVLAYKAFKDEESGFLQGEIFSFSPISDGRVKELEAFLKRFFKKKIALSWKEDKTLIAGAVIKIGPYLLDGSADRSLQTFETQGISQ